MIFQVEPEITKKDVTAVSDYMSSGGWLTEHKITAEFEESISSFVGRDYAIAAPNGTIAIYLSLKALGITTGDRVAVPNITMIATINAIIWTGATPVLVDIDEDMCMSFESLSRITKLKAVIFVPLNGRIGEGELIQKWCKKNKIKLIEDSAHSLGSQYGNCLAGNLGDMSIFSFTPHKIITTGQGGMVLTNNKSLADFITNFKSFNRQEGKSDWHADFGLNFKYTDLQASLGVSQFSRLEKNIKIKRKIYNYYKKNVINDFFYIKDFKKNEVPWFFDIVTKNSTIRDNLQNYLMDLDIETRFSYPALSKQKYLKDIERNNLNSSEKIHDRIMWLPSSLGLKEIELKLIVEKLNDFKA